MTSVVITGSRDWENSIAIYWRLALLPKDTLIIHGGARGADMMAHAAALMLGLETKVFIPDWSNGRQAGFERNLEMLDQKPDRVIAFHRDNSNGTAHTIQNARKRGIPVEVYEEVTTR